MFYRAALRIFLTTLPLTLCTVSGPALAGWKSAQWGMTPHEMAQARAPQFSRLSAEVKKRYSVKYQQQAELSFNDVIYDKFSIFGVFLFTNGRLTGVSSYIGRENFAYLKDRLYLEKGRPTGAKVGVTDDLECRTFWAFWTEDANQTSIFSQTCNRGIGDYYHFSIEPTQQEYERITRLPARKFELDPNDENGKSEIDEINHPGKVRGQICKGHPTTVYTLGSMGVAPDCTLIERDVQIKRRVGSVIEVVTGERMVLSAEANSVLVECSGTQIFVTKFLPQGGQPDFTTCR